MAVQWAHLGPGEVLVASDHGAWIQYPELGALGLVGPMPSSLTGTPATTCHLLDGAIAAAERAAAPARGPQITARWWAWQLVNQWYCAHHSIALLAEVVERYGQTQRPDLAAFARRKLEEETGHDQFPLSDLRALGYDAEPLVLGVPPAPAAAAGIDYARRCVRGDHPVDFLGYVHAIERHVIRASAEWLAAVEAVLPQGVDAMSGLRAHASDLDVEHVHEAVLFFAGLPADDRTRIALAGFRTTQIRNAPLPGQHPSETQLEGWLKRFQRVRIPSGGLRGRTEQGEPK